MNKKFKELYNIIQQNISKVELNVFDIGASGGFSEKWNFDFINKYGAEPDIIEFEKLKKDSKVKIFNTAFFDEHKQEIEINICKKQQVSSVFTPNIDFLNKYPDVDRFEIINKYKTKVETLDSLILKENLLIDVLKIDTQGCELNILDGGKKCLEKTLFLEIEIEFQEFYKGQPLFNEVDSFLRKTGFRLLNINPIEWYRNVNKRFNGKKELIFCDAFYIKDDTENIEHSKISLLKKILILVNYEFYEVAYFILLENKHLINEIEFGKIHNFFNQIENEILISSKKDRLKNKIKSIANRILNKLI